MRKNLKEARVKKGLTQKELADKLNLTTRQYCRLENKHSDGSLKVWVQLKDLFNIPIDKLIE